MEIPLYSLLFAFIIFLALFFIFTVINFYHILISDSFTLTTFLVTVITIALTILTLWYTWELLQNIDWKEPLVTINIERLKILFGRSEEF